MPVQPNILFLFPDQHRGDWVPSNADLPIRMPNLAKLAERGMTFTRCYTPSPLCAPARACLASGRSYDRCGVKNNGQPYPLDQPTYYQSLRDAAYHVCGVGKFDLDKPNLTWNVDGSHHLEEWGFTSGIDNEGKFDGSTSYLNNERTPQGPYLAYLAGRGLADEYCREHREVRHEFRDAYVTSLDEEAYCDNWLSENGKRFLRGFPAGTPWHLVVNFTGPHNPMDVTQRMHDAWDGVAFPPPHENHQENYFEDDHQRNRRHYAAELENIDRQVGEFMKIVEERGELDNTLVVYSSDHGEMLGEYGRWGKSTWQEPSVLVPLVAAGPGVKPNTTSDALVSLEDLAATFVDYAGSAPMPGMDARSLRPLLEGASEPHRDVVVGGLNDWRFVVDARFKLVRKAGEEPCLYDREAGPWEDEDVASQHPEVVARLRASLPDETRNG